MDDLNTAARLWVRTLAVKVSDAAEDLLDGGGVITDDIGRLRHVIPVPGHRKSQHTTVKIREGRETGTSSFSRALKTFSRTLKKAGTAWT